MTRVIEGAGVPLAMEDAGPADGPPVLIVHGMADDALTWVPAAGELVAVGLRVVTYDRRGYGGSGVPQPYTGTTVAEQAADALAVLDAAGLEAATIAGDGFGALVALDLALRVPERVTALVCVDPPLLVLVPDAAHGMAHERLRLEDALRAGGRAGAIADWLDGRVDADALARAQAAAAGFFADYAGLASLPVTRRALGEIAVGAALVTDAGADADLITAADALATLIPGALRLQDAGLVAGVQAVTGR
jgi:pimeloyl-ACP methyl ester carboxylesterase